MCLSASPDTKIVDLWPLPLQSIDESEMVGVKRCKNAVEVKDSATGTSDSTEGDVRV
jgi:hypothetical protein